MAKIMKPTLTEIVLEFIRIDPRTKSIIAINIDNCLRKRLSHTVDTTIHVYYNEYNEASDRLLLDHVGSNGIHHEITYLYEHEAEQTDMFDPLMTGITKAWIYDQGDVMLEIEEAIKWIEL